LTSSPLKVRNGWTFYQHPAFREQFDALVAEVENLSQTLNPKEFEQHAKVRFLTRVRKIILEDVPSDPASKIYELENTLGTDRRYWHRAKFNQRFRLFFRFHSKARIIVYAWINDENPLRARGARNDAYTMFERCLKSGNPPDDWDQLMRESQC
jgi:toxin YhaV